MAAGTGAMLHSPFALGVDAIDPRTDEIVARTIGIDTHNHIDVPLTAAAMPGPDIDLKGEMKRSALSAICMTFATDYQPGDAYDRFLKGLTSMDRQLERNNMKRSLTPADVRTAHKDGQPTVIQAVEGAHFLQGHLERRRSLSSRAASFRSAPRQRRYSAAGRRLHQSSTLRWIDSIRSIGDQGMQSAGDVD
jgi:uncharacterized ParB-like nuclease family protein